MGVLDMADVDLSALMKQDEDLAEALDVGKRELLVRRLEVEADRVGGRAGDLTRVHHTG